METTSVATGIFEGDNSAHALYMNAHGAKRNPDWEPYQKLMLRVLEDAFDCLGQHPKGEMQGNDTIAVLSRRKAQLRKEALEWINDHEADGPFAFGTICHVLGFDAVATRRNAVNGKIGTRARRSPVLSSPPRITDKLRRTRRTAWSA